MAYRYNPFTGEFDRVDSGGIPLKNRFPITPYVVGPTGQAGYQTIQAGIDAANAAGGGMVWIQTGTYTEDLTLYDGIALFGDGEQNTFITGTHTPPSSGTLNLNRLTLQDATAIFSSAAAGTTAIIVEDSTINVTNGYAFDLLNWTSSGSVAVFNIGNFGTDDGFVNNTGGMGFFCFAAGIGNGTSNSMILSGFCEFAGAVEVGCPISLQTGAALTTIGCLYDQTITVGNNATFTSQEDSFNTGSDAAILYSSSGNSSITNSSIKTSNNPAITGAGAGTLTLSGVDFVENFNIATTLTMASGMIRGGNFISQYVVATDGTAPYTTIQAAIDDATLAGGAHVIWIQPGTYTEDLNITSSITFMSIDGAATIVGVHTPPTTGTVTFDGFVLVSATDILNSSAAGVTTFNVNNSFIVITNGYIFNLPNWSGELLMDNCGEASTEDGVVNNITGSSSIKFLNVEMGAGSKTMELNGDAAGFLRFDTVNVNCPVNMLGDGDLFLQNGVKFANTVTIGGTLSGFAIDTNFRGGASQALTYNSSGNFSISNGEIQSTNNPAIGGTGSGTLTLTSVAFPDDNNLAATLTVAGGNQYSATYKSDYTDGGVILGQGALTNMVATTAGTNGQLLIGGTGVDPAFADLTSTGATITITAGSNTLNVEAAAAVPTSFDTDSGTATPAANVLDIVGTSAQGISTSGATNVVTVTASDATTSQKGVSELATSAETLTGTDTGRTIVPSGLTAKLGVQTADGIGYGTGTTTALAWTAGLTDGQLAIGSTAGVPAAGAIASADGSITVTLGANTIDLATAGTVADSFPTDSGTATPSSGVLNVVGGGSTTTSGASNTVTVVLTGLTNHAVLVGAGTTTMTKVGPDAATGIPLISQGASADPVFGTAVVAGGGTGAVTLTDGGILLGSGTGAITATAQPASGELLIGSVGVDPVLATLTAGTGITITEGAGSITIDSTAGGVTWNEETGTSATMVVNNGYITNNAGLVTMTLPATAALGDLIQVNGKGAGGWLIAQNAGQTVHFLAQSTTAGAGGSLASTVQYDCVTYRCITANTTWVVETVVGNLTVV